MPRQQPSLPLENMYYSARGTRLPPSDVRGRDDYALIQTLLPTTFKRPGVLLLRFCRMHDAICSRGIST